jgi:hypothetical protein
MSTNTGYFKLESSDWVKGAATAVFAGIIFAIAGAVQAPGFDLFAANWGAILGSALNAAVAAFVGYIAKGLATAKDGTVLGIEASKPKN